VEPVAKPRSGADGRISMALFPESITEVATLFLAGAIRYG
jgi:hypothetical protein